MYLIEVIKQMKAMRITTFFLLLCLGLLSSAAAMAQQVEYSHPLHPFSFEASPSWIQELHAYNGKVFEVTNPNNNMHILMSFIPDCRNAKKHLRTLSARKGLICSQKPYDTLLNQSRAVVIQGNCLQEKKPFKRMLIGIPGKEGLYLMEISCPADCYKNHKTRLNGILGSLKVDV